MKKQKKKYERPLRPWDKERIEKEKGILKIYGLRRKNEIWRAEAFLRRLRGQVRSLAASRDPEKEKIILEKLYILGLVRKDATLDDILVLTTENILERRLQTIVFKKGIAKTPVQARQFIVHGHISVNGTRSKWPSALINAEDEKNIALWETSKIRGLNA